MSEHPSPTNVQAIRDLAYQALINREWARAADLFASVFDGTEAAVATCLGYVYSHKDSLVCDRAKAILYYRIAAEAGDKEAIKALGGLLYEEKDDAEACRWLGLCSADGDAECSYFLYRSSKRAGQRPLAAQSLQIAARRGHPLAAQKWACDAIIGRYGASQVINGLVLYFKNLPKLYNYVKQID
jgi:TPR repeat protein